MNLNRNLTVGVLIILLKGELSVSVCVNTYIVIVRISYSVYVWKSIKSFISQTLDKIDCLFWLKNRNLMYEKR